jgi:hypothetical protein
MNHRGQQWKKYGHTGYRIFIIHPGWRVAVRQIGSFIFLSIGLLVILSIPSSAHHSEADYDFETAYVMKGTVTKVDFVNPHIVVRYDVKTKDGELEQWVSHGGAPNAERRAGWTPNTIKPGDDVVVTGFRQIDGRNILQMAIIVVNGKVFERTSGSAFRRLLRFKQDHPDRPLENYN